MLGQPLSRFVAEDSQDACYLFIRGLLEEKADRASDLTLKREGGGSLRVVTHGTAKDTVGDGSPYILLSDFSYLDSVFKH